MKKKILITIAAAFVVLLVFMLGRTNIKTDKMTSAVYPQFKFYFEESDKTVIDELNSVLSKNYERIQKELDYSKAGATEVYIYPDISSFQASARGRIVPLLNQRWFIGDNRLDKVLLVSPLNTGGVHDKHSVIQASVHEYTHTIIQSINKAAPKYLDEGLAMYFADQSIDYSFISSKEEIPDMKKVFYMKNNSINALKFGLDNGYQYSYAYAKFLVDSYGMERVRELVRAPKDIEKALGESEEKVYQKWVSFLEANYMFRT